MSEGKLKRFVKRSFDFKLWMDYDRLRQGSNLIVDTTKDLFKLQQPRYRESMSEACRRFGLTETDLIEKMRALWRLSMMLIVFAGVIFAYFIYQVMYGSWNSVLLTLVITFIPVALAFRYHFWYFQIRERKLGCTLQEWFRFGLLGHKR